MRTPLLLSAIFATLAWYISAIFIIFCILGILDARARYKEYKSNVLYIQSGDLDHIITKRRHTHCQRQAMIAAGYRMGIGSKVRKSYISMGYRWYHIFPDWILKKPETILKPSFWRAFLGIKRKS